MSSRIARKLIGYRNIKEMSTRQEVVFETELQPHTGPTIALNNQYERIKDVHEFSSSIEEELTISTRICVEHRKTVAYQLKELFLIYGNLCSYRDFEYLSFKRPAFKPALIKKELSTAALSSSIAGNDFFAHFVFDDASTAVMAADFGPVVFANLGVSRTEHMLSYLDAFNIKNYQDLETAYFNRVWVFDDIGLNTHKVNRLLKHRDLLKLSRNNLSSPGCYITRGESGSKRELSNEREIIEELEKRGFNIIEPEKLSLSEIVDQLNGSPLAIGIEGSHLIHAVMNLHEGGTLICIQPPTRFNAVFRSLTTAVNLNWGFVVGIGNTETFHVPVEDILSTIDLVHH